MITSEANWQQSDTYKYASELVRADWAWEGLRRDREFQQSWFEAQSRFRVVEEHAHLRIITVPNDNRLMTRWGCLFSDAPDHNAATATVIWQPEKYSRVLPMEAFAQNSGPRAALFRLYDMPCSTTLLMTPDGVQHLFIGDGGRSFQLAITGTSLLEPVRLLADAVLHPKDAGRRLAAVQCFNDLRATGRLVRSHFPAERASPRLRLVIQALDGVLAGASHREIAVALFGAARVEKEWTDRGAHLRDRVRRAIKRGKAVMKGGYLKFLR